MKQLYSIDLPYANFGIVVTDNICAESVPIAKWMIGKPFSEISRWVNQKKGTIKLVKELESER